MVDHHCLKMMFIIIIVEMIAWDDTLELSTATGGKKFCACQTFQCKVASNANTHPFIVTWIDVLVAVECNFGIIYT